jgi:hypothetical protein
MNVFLQRLAVLLFLLAPIGSAPAEDKMISGAPEWLTAPSTTSAPHLLWKFAEVGFRRQFLTE